VQPRLIDVLSEELALPDGGLLLRFCLRLFVAGLLGGLLGWEREREGKAAGLRTHILVAMGAALFTVAPLEAGMPMAEIGRVVQGVAAGVGFLGAGSILKLANHEHIKGLTTAATIWLTAAVGLAVGSGRMWLSALGVFFALLTLSVLSRVERRFAGPAAQDKTRPAQDT
jgi:putative Mg2+ transporter-C (MgtC) family protein